MLLCGIVLALLSLYLNIGLKTLMPPSVKKAFSRDCSFKFTVPVTFQRYWCIFEILGFLKQWAFSKAFVTFGKMWAMLYDLLWTHNFLPQISKHKCWCVMRNLPLRRGILLCETQFQVVVPCSPCARACWDWTVCFASSVLSVTLWWLQQCLRAPALT